MSGFVVIYNVGSVYEVQMKLNRGSGLFLKSKESRIKLNVSLMCRKLYNPNSLQNLTTLQSPNIDRAAIF